MTEEEAVAIANDTVYGLTNYVQSQDGAKRNRMARRLRSGMVEMNGKSRGAGAPFGGVKASGRAREGGVWGLKSSSRSRPSPVGTATSTDPGFKQAS
jgi:aldehyde dehydrogenase (NAD+)